MENQSKNVETIKMVERALAVLDLLRARRERLGVNEIAKLCELNPSTAFRILKTLEKSGWAFQFTDGRYIPGEKISFVTEKNNLYLALKDVSAFIMNRYTEEWMQAMNLTVRDGAECFILQQSRTKNLVDYVVPLNSAMPFYACAGGKVLLSELPIPIVDMLLESTPFQTFTPNTIADPEHFWNELRLVARQGYAFDDRESSANGSCIAVPVRDNQGTIIAALSFSGFIGVEDPKTLLKYLPALREASEQISKALYACREE
ncbi:IclR family transcriptional regulator [Flavonifractor sp. DFI.6.63]|nr:IclR family transcriptional regulator [Flavonifractor sp. DFI.6.63]MCQ5030951.1 IclR family transcriptional regulator [Flavonifractor sp. DFI.6.63]